MHVTPVSLRFEDLGASSDADMVDMKDLEPLELAPAKEIIAKEGKENTIVAKTLASATFDLTPKKSVRRALNALTNATSAQSPKGLRNCVQHGSSASLSSLAQRGLVA